MTTPFQVMQWRAWLRGEIRAGHAMPHSRGSVRARAARELGVPWQTPRETLLAALDDILETCQEQGVGMTQRIEIDVGDDAGRGEGPE